MSSLGGVPCSWTQSRQSQGSQKSLGSPQRAVLSVGRGDGRETSAWKCQHQQVSTGKGQAYFGRMFSNFFPMFLVFGQALILGIIYIFILPLRNDIVDFSLLVFFCLTMGLLREKISLLREKNLLGR